MDTSESDDDGMVTVPNLVGKTEDEAKNITKDMKLGIQPMGEEASNQAKGTISSQDIPKGSKVEQYTTIKYYISKGAQKITIPDVDGQTGVDAQQTLEDMGLTVEIQKEYSELNDDGTPVTDPGYAVSTTPAAGNSVSAGDSVTLLVSRGVDYGDSVEVPSVVGMTKNDAVTTFGKFLNVEVKEEKSTEVAEGEVISQEPEAHLMLRHRQQITVRRQQPGSMEMYTDSEYSVRIFRECIRRHRLLPPPLPRCLLCRGILKLSLKITPYKEREPKLSFYLSIFIHLIIIIFVDTSESDDDGMVTVPNLVGKTEDEAKNITKDMKLGIQPMGEEASNQAKGTISSQDIPKGSKVEQYTTIKYYISKGAQKITIPDVDGQTGVDAQQTLEDMGLTVEIQKEYSELNDDGTPVTDPGYAVSTTPAAGNSVSAGDSVTLLVSRGVDYGDSVEVPSVVGMTKNDAVTTFGKFLNVEVKEEKSTEVAEGEVISQEPEAGNWEDPDNVNVVITVSTGDQEPSAQSDSADTAASSDAPAQTADNSAAAAAGEVWKCTQTLNTPSGYSGGPVRLELIQNVNGTPTASVVLEDQVIQFPYDLDITGAPGISEGTLYLSEQINGTYQELGNYSITFAKAE